MSSKRLVFVLFTALLIASLSSCTVMKRHYSRGFYVSSKNDRSSRTTTSSVKIKKDQEEIRSSEMIAKQVTVISHAPATEMALAKQTITASNKKEPIFFNERPLGCDTLFLKDGTVIAARVLEISMNQVKFRYCSGSDMSEKAILKKDIDHITYANGTQENFDVANAHTSSGRSSNGTEVNGFAVAGFIFSLLFYPALLIALFAVWTVGGYAGTITILAAIALIYLLGLIFSIVGIIQISNNRDKYKGLALAIVGLVISLIPLIIIAASSFRI